MVKPKVLTSQDIVKVLAIKHSKDVFIEQCKDGPTGLGLAQLDVWAMEKSWAHPRILGYEVKINRQDFLRDNKWHKYLEMCNELIFVCPSNLIQISEVSDDCGLMWVSKTGNMLWTKKKAKFRDIKTPDGVFRYILMCRARIIGESGSKESSTEFWNNWLKQKEQDLDIGHRVSRRLNEIISEKINKAEIENKKLKEKNDDYEEIKQLLVKLGYDPKDFWSYKVQRYIEDVDKMIPESLTYELANLQRSLKSFDEEIQKLKPKPS